MTKLRDGHLTKYSVVGMKKRKTSENKTIGFEMLVDLYLLSLKNTKENTKANYQNHLNQVAKHLTTEALKDVDVIDDDMLNLVERDLLANHSKNTTIQIMKTLKRVLAYAVKKGFMEASPFEYYEPLKKEEQLQYCPTDAEIARIKTEMEVGCTTLEQLRYRVAILLILDTGNRLNETLKLKWEYFNRDEKGYWKVTMDKTTTKNGKTYAKVVSNQVAEMLNDLKDYADENSIYIFETRNHKPIPSQNLQRYLGKLVKVINPSISVHSLRRYKATKVYRETKDIVLVSRFILHHSDVKTTELYLNIQDTEADDVLFNLF